MKHSISASELARRLGKALRRIRHRGDSFLVEREGVPVARVVPVPGASTATVREAFAAWSAAGPTDPEFADDLERIGEADRVPEHAWDS